MTDKLKNENIKVIAITGRSGSGKSTVSDYFAKHDQIVLNADEAAKKAVEKGSECLKKLAAIFGNDIILQDGNLNKSLLASRAFKTSQQAKLLTDTTHPYIVNILKQGINSAKKSGKKVVFVDGAVIIGGMFEQYCDEFIVVTSLQEQAINRIILRDNIDRQQAERRLAAQKTQEEMLQKATYVIENNNNMHELLKSAKNVLNKII